MSLTNPEEVKCPCGEIFEAELVSCINVKQNPELKDTLMAGELNVVLCPACSKVLYADRFLLYIDMPEELIAYIHPESSIQQGEQLKQRMNEDFAGIQSTLNDDEKLGCSPIIIFGMDNMLRLLIYEEDRNLEMKVLEHFTKTREDISLVTLKPSRAREMHLPYLLPVIINKETGKENFRSSVLAGLKKLLELAPGLIIYSAVQKRIHDDPDWKIDEKAFQKR